MSETIALTTPVVPSAGANPQPAARAERVESIDLVRGLVMVVMVLDHVRDFFLNSSFDPTDLETTTPALFFTRWITHFCAPTFMLLAGVSAYLSGRKRSRSQLSWHLLTRGLILIVLEQTWCNVFFFFSYPRLLIGIVLWAIGWSMIALALLIHLPRWAMAAIGLAMVAGHNLLDGVNLTGRWPSLAWTILHTGGSQTLPGGIRLHVLYPLIPWIGVMALGYVLGPVFLRQGPDRRRFLLGTGLGLLALFVGLRWLNVYGDPIPWQWQAAPLRSLMAFLNCDKYPPSLLFLCMTLSGTFLALWAFDRGLGRAGHPLRVFGQTALFYYLLQWPLAHGLAVLVAWLQGFPVAWMFAGSPSRPPSEYGQSLLQVYVFWAVTVALLYPPCLWYLRWSRSRRNKSKSLGGPSQAASTPVA